ncbi:hypothetical protein [Flavobacterium panacagri]|uniref:hypothetical protein n=1 Tax=Flavobacterium panacagri TaxID=3034146 RepID=UPI0025A5D73B|nr:hypothetical protein [Flavobacterium panacagri]
MKKYASLILFAFLLNGCDDGDLTVQEINFESVDPTSCTQNNDVTLLYKLKSQEAFLLQMPANAGLKEDTGEYEYDIPTGGKGTYRAIYRAYDGALVSDNICGIIPPSTPKVTDEWIATSGKIVINTTQKDPVLAADGSTKLTGYNHDISFKNITFDISGSKPQTYPTYPFGTFSTTTNVPASLVFDSETAGRCTNNGLNRVYNFSAAFFIMLDNLDPELIKNEVTATGKPRTGLINQTTTTNKLYYKAVAKDSGSFSSSYFCNTTFPASPAIGEDWTGQTGEAEKSGIIEVTTTLVGNTYYHTVTLRNVTMLKGKSNFKLPTEFFLGRFETNL